MLHFLCLKTKFEPGKIKYMTISQLTNVYTDSHLSTQTESSGNAFDLPSVFTSRPLFEDGWLWSIETPHENISAGMEDIKCGSGVALVNHYTRNYVSVKNNKMVVPTVGSMSNSSTWRVDCEKGPEWHQNDEFMLYNELQKCYLTGSFEYMYDGDTSKYVISCLPTATKFSVWSIKEGIFFKETPTPEPEPENQQNEL